MHQNSAYIVIAPGLNDGHDAANATIKTEVALVLNEYSQKNIYPLVLTVFSAGKEVVMMYCDGTNVHGYKGGENTVVKLISLKIDN